MKQLPALQPTIPLPEIPSKAWQGYLQFRECLAGVVLLGVYSKDGEGIYMFREISDGDEL